MLIYMKEKLYIAYGSNLDRGQMARRCPTAEVVCSGMLYGHELLFRGSQFGAAATVEPKPGACVPVCALPGFVDSKNEEKTERNAGYLVVSHSGGGMLRQGTRKGIRRTPANRGMRAHRIVKGLDISEDVCHGMCP